MGAIVLAALLLMGFPFYLIYQQTNHQKDIAIECIKAGKEFQTTSLIQFTCVDKKQHADTPL